MGFQLPFPQLVSLPDFRPILSIRWPQVLSWESLVQVFGPRWSRPISVGGSQDKYMTTWELPTVGVANQNPDELNTRWCFQNFQRFFIFTPTWENDPI